MPDVFLDSPWLLLAALPLAGVAAWVLVRTGSPLRRLRQGLGGLGIAVAIICLLLMSAGIAWNEPSDRRTVWVVVDRSLSAGPAAEKRLQGVLEELKNSIGPGDYVGVIGFSDRASIILSPTAAADIEPALALPANEPSDETWLANALELASRAASPGTVPVALLLGDGHDSADRYGGDSTAEARDRAVPVFVIAVDSDPMPEVALADFNARLAGRDRRVLAVDIVIQSTVAQYVVPHVRINGQDMRERVTGDRLDAQGGVRVGAGRTPLRLAVEPPEESRLYVVEVSVGAEQDTYPGNGSAKLAVAGEGDARVLLLHGPNGPEKALERALKRIGMNVTSGPAAMLPGELIDLQRYQVLLLCDVPAPDISTSQQRMIERFTREGGGLAMLGGPNSYAPGGWFETSVEKVLPVTCDVTEKGRKQTPALVIAFDRSGSMGAEVGGVTKMDLANEGAARTINLVPPGTMFGMLSVDTQPEWIVPLARLADRKQAIGRARGNTVGGGGIFVDVAVDEAIAALKAVESSSRHLVLFSDGSDTERQEGVIDTAIKANQEDGITITTICLGAGKDRGFLEALAAAGKGRFFLVTDASDLPAVFSREAALSAGTFIREDAFRPWHGLRGRLVEEVDFENEGSPVLLGYVGTTARPEANVWLWADEDKERPLLATWHIELGKALSWTSDARDRWADQWLPWDRFDELWQRWVRWLLPEPERVAGVETEWVLGREGPTLQLSFYDEEGNPRALNTPVAEISLPDGSTRPSPVLPHGAGEYRVHFPRSGSGIYSVVVRELNAEGEQRAAAREHRIFVPVEELYRRPAAEQSLQALADATGGKVITSAREAAISPVEGGYSTVRPRPWLLMLALGGMLLAIGARRFPSVWRRREEKNRAQQAQQREQSAAAAYDRVRKQLQERNKPAAPQPTSGAWAAPVPAPRQPAPPPPRQEEAPVASGSLLSAMRKVRKQLEERKGDQ